MPSATQRTQECHRPSRVGRVRLSPRGRPLLMPLITKAARQGLKSQKQMQHNPKLTVLSYIFIFQIKINKI